MLQTYGEYRPTACDPPGAFLSDRRSWFVAPCALTRDSDTLEESNWFAQLCAIGEGEDAEVHEFGHWGPGWFRLLLVRPGTPAAAVARLLAVRLNDHPVLDEEEFSAREVEAQAAAWDSYGAADFAAGLVSSFNLSDRAEDRLLMADPSALWDAFTRAIPSGDYGGTDNYGFRCEVALSNITRGDVARLLRSLAPRVTAP